MKLTYLGTAAAEGFPAVFCRCEHCLEARRRGGKNVRTRSQALVNGDLLIDLPADTYHHFLMNGIEGDAISHLLITHSHPDHLYPTALTMRSGCYAHNMRVETLEVFASAQTLATLGEAPENVSFTSLVPFQPTAVGQYMVTALPARHEPCAGAVMYLIEGEKTLLYAHDSGYFYEEVFEHLAALGKVLDMVSYDCTCGDIPVGDEGRHMGFENIARVKERLCALGVTDAHTVHYVNHFSHNAAPLQEEFEQRAATIGCGCSFDGCAVEF